MAVPFSDLGRGFISARDEMHALEDQYRAIIIKLEFGEMPVDVPWHDARFQAMLIRRLGALHQYKADADKLAVIRDVFRGK